ncbi:hypothetical protein [Streptococcus ruminantium]|uniref:hypothetical protein n=1 Tax=Streptococcus ruminantium TaxID=1917441 RepID=UPI0012DEACE8|nr:hypothetical protein [Streptococcus ruminantium]
MALIARLVPMLAGLMLPPWAASTTVSSAVSMTVSAAWCPSALPMPEVAPPRPLSRPPVNSRAVLLA